MLVELPWLLSTALLAAPPVTVHVAPGGNDAWSGRRAALTAPDGPVATLPRAQALARPALAAGGGVEVVLAPGTYHLSAPLVLGPEDSGRDGAPAVWRAGEGGEVILSGGRPISGWTRRGNLWVAKLPEAAAGQLDFKLLRVGDRWADRARHPNADPAQPITGGWACAQFGGEPWERGALNQGVQNTQNVGTLLGWTVDVPAAGNYTVWLRYAHHMAAYQKPDMSGASTLAVNDAPGVPLQNLPDTGGWSTFQWARAATLELPAGRQRLTWRNVQGGGLNLDAFALCSDAGWDPNQAVGAVQWWGAADVKLPAGGHLLLVQCEACDRQEGAELNVPKVTPPGQRTHLTYAPEALPAIADPRGAEVHVFIAWGWVNAIVPIASIDPDKRRIVFTEGGAAQDVRPGNRYFVENARELLDAPREWFWDRAAGELLYIPGDEPFPNVPVVAPLLDHLIELRGDAAQERWAEHIELRGLTCTDTSYNLTRDYYTPTDGAIRLAGARHCRIRGCTFRWCGGYGVKLTERSHEVAVTRSTFHDLGMGGVHLQGGTAVQPHPCQITHNTMQRLGRRYKHVAGVYATHASDCLVAHNRITDVPRYAISFKSQGEDRLSHRNVIEYNDLQRSNLETNDTGAIETLGYEHRDSGNIIRFNRILDVVGLMTDADGQIHTPHFTWGVYMDDYSSGTLIYGNIIARTQLGGVCIHGGQNVRVENNILVEGYHHQVRMQPRDDYCRDNLLRRNIIVYSRPEADLVYGYRNQPNMLRAEQNLYWLIGGDPRLVERKLTYVGTWAEWLAAGQDAGSLIADPKFVDPAHDDYTLAPDSPAWKLGFERIPVELIGPQPEPAER
ncbi:MAG: right-handed parallel beta-helix repeat-containing protein [Fimbriimonadaceae bacterium]|nr:right-handed parallel beta-helix repeat-containing protein [Fimbriimonadaceae bacterium]